MPELKVMTVFGTRPEAVKMAPVIKELKKHPELIKTVVAVTAQHRAMLDQVLRLFDIMPDYDLNIMLQNQDLFDVTVNALEGLKKVLAAERPDIVLVHGDTTTTFAAAMAAYYLQIPVGHVEAGLRTYHKYSPFPEEINRRLTDAVADIHFAPTAKARQNLLAEGIPGSSIFVTGNTVIDALLFNVRANYVFQDPRLNMDYEKNRAILVTTHRRENLGDPLKKVYEALKTLLSEYNDVRVIFPVHKNPRVRSLVEDTLGGLDRVLLTEPLEYEPFVNLMNKCYLVLTDSGGIQEEAPSLGKPVLVLRDTTERPEALEAGTVKLVGTGKAEVYQHCKLLLDNKKAYDTMANAVNPFGDGKAATRTVQALLYFYGLARSRPKDFKSL